MVANASRTIKSAHRVLEILEYFDQDRRIATVMEMSRTLNYPQSSTSELLRCLTRLGYLHYNRVRRTYSPTTRVALLGAWVKPSLFRGGPVLSAVDEIAKATGQTVVLSTSTNYVLQHLHVIHGNEKKSVDIHAGDEISVLHSIQGRLLLASYNNDSIRSAVHRLNAEEPDISRHLRLADLLPEFAELREKGWAIEANDDGLGSVAMLLPFGRNMDRLTVSVFAEPEVIAEHGQDFLKILQDRKIEIAKRNGGDEEVDHEDVQSSPVPEVKIYSYHRNFA